jgi:GT2 family glycosyltransferase
MISALIVNHNGAATLERCLASLPAGRPGGLEAVVVDTASTDGSAALAAGFPFARLVALGSNVGFGAATNRAAIEARGETFLLLNNDAWLEPGSLDLLEARLAADLRLAWVSPRLVYPDGRPQTSWVPTTGLAGEALQRLRNRFEGRRWSHAALPRLLRLADPGWYTAACALVRRQAFDAVGGFDEGFFLYFEDVDLCLRLRRAGWRLAEEPAAVAVHAKGGAGGGVTGAAEAAYRTSQLRFYAKHRPGLEQRLLRRHLARKYAGRDDETGRRVRELLAAG